jgi:hypothetical protein
MTDPVFALEPDMPRNARVARWLLFRLLNGLRVGSLTLREGGRLTILATRPPRCAQKCRSFPRSFTGVC